MNWENLSILEEGLNAAALRQRVMANNIANINTPSFKASRVSFEAELRNWLSKEQEVSLVSTHPRHLGSNWTRPKPKIVKSDNPAMRPDGNNVDLDSEQVMLAANLINFQGLAQQVDSQLASMRYVITGGRR